jgi:hypothetical protein
MEDVVTILAALAIWWVVQALVLPRFGVPT